MINKYFNYIFYAQLTAIVVLCFLILVAV